MDDDFRKKDREMVLESLNKHFKTFAAEKYPTAVLEFYFTEGIKKFVGEKPFRSIGKRKRKKVVEYVLKKLRAHYGKYINILSFDKKGRYVTNFDYVFKTEYGRLYGYDPYTNMSLTFLTTHSLERFEERVPEDNYRDFITIFKQYFGVEPTAADVLKYLMLVAVEMGITKDCFYVNFVHGVAVIEPLPNGIFIVKTVLTPEMVNRKIDWFVFVGDDSERINIGNPSFDTSRFTWEFYEKLIQLDP